MEEDRRARKDKKQSGRNALASRARGTRRPTSTRHPETNEHEVPDTSEHEVPGNEGDERHEGAGSAIEDGREWNAETGASGQTSKGSEIGSRRERDASSDTGDRSEMAPATENGSSETSEGSEMGPRER